MTQFILETVWQTKRHLFTQDEMLILNKYIEGETICPRGVAVTVNEQTQSLLARLQ